MWRKVDQVSPKQHLFNIHYTLAFLDYAPKKKQKLKIKPNQQLIYLLNIPKIQSMWKASKQSSSHNKTAVN